jgi:putative ABC transport system permease protein
MPESKLPAPRRFFRFLLRLFPFDFRQEYGREMTDVFEEQRREAKQRAGVAGIMKLWAESLWGILGTAPREHLDILRQDCLCAFRVMQNNRGFTAIAVLTLALGIGANTAIFSAVDAVLLRPLPYSQGQQLVFIREQAKKVGVDDIQWSVPEINDYRRQNDVLSALVEYHSMSFTLFGHGEPDRVKAGVVSWNYFDVFGIRPVLGRNFRPQDDRIGAPPVLLLSNEYWRAKFAADPNVVGETFEMNDKVHTVIGVLPAIPQYPRDNDVYMPTSACPFRSSKDMIEDRGGRMMEVFGRLKPGVTLGQAQADFSTIASRLELEYPKSYPPRFGYAVAVAPLKQTLTQSAQPTLLALLAAAVFVLLIACANVANLTLSRMAKREREFAVRTALGAGRIRLLRQLFTENFLLALLGAAAGLMLAYGSLPLLTDFAARLSPRAREIRIDSGVLWFTLLVAFGSSILFGSISALFSRVNLTAGLKEGSAASGTGGNRARSVLVVSQVAFSFVLLIGAGLMLRSLVKMLQVNPGFVPQHVLAMRVNFNWSKYKTMDRYPELGKKLVDRIETEPGVISATVASSYPLQPDVISGGPNLNSFQIEGKPLGPSEAPPISNTVVVSPEFFRTLGIPLIRGREFLPSDDDKESKIAIINQAMQHRFWPNEDPIGRRISFNDGKEWWRIVGVVGDVHDLGLDRKPALQSYLCLAQGGGVGTLLVRTAMDPGGITDSLIRAVHDVDPTTAVSEVLTLDRARSDSLSSPRTTASLLGLFAALALVIATAGIGGILALMVSQRVHEIGIRMALGAPPHRVLVMILRHGLLLAILGIGIGFVGAISLTGLVRSLVFEVTPTDPFTFMTVLLVFIAAALLASYLPARRAASIAPIEALRCE